MPAVRQKRIACKVDGCKRRRWVSSASGAKYCRWHSITIQRNFGLGHTKLCNYLTGPKQKCRARFVPLHQGDLCCEEHSLPLNTEHRKGACAECGREKRLYLSADWCTACLRALPAGEAAPAQPKKDWAAHQPGESEFQRRVRVDQAGGRR